MRLTPRRVTFIGVAALAAIALLQIAFLSFQGSQTRNARQMVAHTYEVLSTADELGRLLGEAQSSLRGYLLTANPDFLSSYTQIARGDAPQIRRTLNKLHTLTTDNPVQRARANELIVKTLTLLNFWQQQITYFDSGDVDTALGKLRRGEGKKLHDQITAELAVFSNEEENLLTTRNYLETTSQVWFGILIVIGLLLSWVGLGACIWFLVRFYREASHLAQAQQAILDGSRYAILATDEDGVARLVNQAAAALTGYSAEELHDNISISQLLTEKPLTGNKLIGDACKNGNVIGETFLRTKNNEIIPIDASLNTIYENDIPAGFIVILHDISARREVDRMKAEFVSTVSHELRTPLTSIRGALGLLVNGATGKLSAEAEKLVKIAHLNSERLVLLVNDILDSERLASGRLQLVLKDVHIADLIEETIAANQGYASNYGVELIVQGKLPKVKAHTDPSRVAQILSNLISNAIKFSPKGEKVTVSAKKRDANTIQIDVHDNGPGIPDEFKQRIFQRFSQADGVDQRKKSGSGLGLSISKGLAERLGGDVTFSSPPNKGTIFTVFLPLKGVPNV